VRPLTSADRGSPASDLGAGQPRAIGQDLPGFLLERHAMESRLEPEALGHFIVQVPDDDRRHGGASV
jgi:hypothetical protein